MQNMHELPNECRPVLNDSSLLYCSFHLSTIVLKNVDTSQMVAVILVQCSVYMYL